MRLESALRTWLPLGLALAVPALVLGADAPGAAPLRDRNWFAAESANFHFMTDCSERRTRDLASDFEVLRQVLNQITPGLRTGRYTLQSPLPTSIYLFDEGRDFDAFAGGKGWAGFFHHRQDGNFVAIKAGVDNARGVVFHEYLHYFVANNFRGTPSWANEGLAEFYSTMLVHDPDVRLGLPVDAHVRTLSHQAPLPLARMMALAMNLHNESNETVRQHYYASAWLTVHYLMLGNPERRTQFGAFLEMVRAGITSGEAFTRAFKGEPAALDAELLDYRSRMMNRVQVMTISLAKLEVPSRFTYAPLPRAEALARLGLLAVNGDPRSRDLANAHLAAALAADPGCATAHGGRGLMASHDQRWAEAAAAYAKALETRPSDPELQFQAGQACFGLVATGGVILPGNAVHGDLIRAQDHLRACLAVEPAHARAQGLLWQLALADPRPSEACLGALEATLAGAPQRLDLRFSLAELYERAKLPEKSRGLWEGLAAQTADPELAERARARMGAAADVKAQAAFREGVAALNAGRPEEGRRLITEAIQTADSPLLKAQFEAFLNRKPPAPVITLTGGRKTPAKPAAPRK